MNRFDFTQNGGFPMTQNRLAWMQEGYINALNALSSMAGSDQPRAVTGVELTSGSWTAGTVSDGWIYHPTEGLMPFVGGAFTTATVGVIYQDVLTPLTFANNSQQNVQISRVASVGPGVVPALQALSVNRWHAGFGKVARTEWTQVAPEAGNAGGELFYCKDALNDRVHVRGFIDRAATGPGPGGGPQTFIGFYMPADVASPRFVGAVAACYLVSVLPVFGITDQDGTVFTTEAIRVSGAAGQTGVQGLGFLWRPLSAAATYRQVFNFSYTMY